MLKSKKIKFISPPMKWNPALNKYEVDLPSVKTKENKTPNTKTVKPTFSKITLVIIILLLASGIGSWLISLLF